MKLLEGIRVLSFCQVGAGPFASLMLADLGADVIKVEDPTGAGDMARGIPPFAIEGDSLFYQSLNRNKRCITLNLRTPEGRALLHRLAPKVDVVFSNMRGDQPKKLGITYDDLAHLNPKIVCCALSGFGSTGPRSTDPAFDYIIQGLAGYMALTGEPDSAPARCGVSVIDFSTGLMAAFAIMSGVQRALRTGRGCDLEVSLYETAISMLNYLAAWNLNEGYQPQRLADSAHPSVVPSQAFDTADGRMVVMCQTEKFWQDFCRLADRGDLLEDRRFVTSESRLEHREELLSDLRGLFRARTTAEWLSLLGTKVPCGPVNTFNEVFAEPQLNARGMVVEVDHPKFGRMRQVGTPVKAAGFEPEYRHGGAIGEDTSRILKELLNCSEEEIQALRKASAI